MKHKPALSTPVDDRSDPADPRYGTALLASWSQRMPDVDASSVPLCAMTIALGRQMELFLESLVKPMGYQLSEYRLLVALYTHEPEGMTPVQLNRILRQTSAGITKTTARIEQQGLIRRRPNPADNRSVLIELTEEGERVIGTLCSHVAREQNKKMAWLQEEQKEAALKGVRVLLQALR